MGISSNKPEKLTHHSLQLEEDIPFFAKEAVFQRIGWIIMFLILVLGCLGLFGTGVLSIRKQQVGDIRFEYEKYLRFESQTELIFRLSATAATTTIAFPLAYHERFRVEKTMPEAIRITVADDQAIYEFATGGPSAIRIFITPTETGSVRGKAAVGHTSFSFSQFIYP